MNESASCKKEQENMGLFQSKSTETQTNSWESFVAQEIQNALNSLNCSFDGKATINTISTDMLEISRVNHCIDFWVERSVSSSKQLGKIHIRFYENKFMGYHPVEKYPITEIRSKIHEVESAWCSQQEISDKMPKYIQYIVDYIDNDNITAFETKST